MAEHSLIDVFRELNPTDKTFSWKQWGAHKFSRLDYFLISNSLLPFVQKVEILQKCFSEHSPILLEIDFAKFKRGRGFWKMNNSLLKMPEYVKIIKDTIKKITCQYAVVNGDSEFFEQSSDQMLENFYLSQTPESLQTLPLKINPELFFETLMMEIRRVTILYSASMKRERNARELLLNHDIEILENQIQAQDDVNERLSEELNIKKAALEEIYKYQAEGAFIRSRVGYKVDGEKPTRLFCALETYNGVQKFVPTLIVNNEEGQELVLNDQKSIETEICSYYSKLYQNKDDSIEIDSIEGFLGQENCQNIPKLSNNQKQSMKGKISVEEMTKYFKKCKNNVSPGSSGFTTDFYKFFWRDVKYFVINSVDFAFDSGRLSVSQSLGIVSIIPKGEKDNRFLTNWRPLTLLNTLYKLVSGCIAERIKPVLSSIIHPDQKGFVAGRYIGEAVRTTYDIMQYAKANNLPGLLLTVDFEKAYDSISFNYISKVLSFLNFSDDIIKWVKILLYNFNAVINHCGNISKRFEVLRGCRQGDPIASYLFILCIEILAHKLRTDRNIEGFHVTENEDDLGYDVLEDEVALKHLLEIYADDLTIYMKPSSQNLRNVVNNLTNFYKLSGLKISVTKTKAVWFGSRSNSGEVLCPDLNLKWVAKFTLLGIEFDSSLEEMKTNFSEKIEKMEKVLSNWSYRHLSPFGKVTVIKSLGLSKLSHIALVMPTPTKDMIKKIETIFYNFLWSKKSEKVRREDTKLPVKYGGLGMPDIAKFWTAFKFSWLRRILNTQSFWPRIVLHNISKILNRKVSACDLLQLGSSKLVEISKQLKNPFWKQALHSTTVVTEGAAFCYSEQMKDIPFFYNPLD